MRRILFVLALAALLATAASGAERPFTIEQVLSAPFPSVLTAAKETSGPARLTDIRLAWTFDARGQRNVWVWVPEGPDFRARQLTFYTADDGQEINEIQWVPGARTLVYVRGQARQQAGNNPNPTSDPAGAEQAIWAVSLDGGAPRRLAAGSSMRVSPAGGRVVFLHEGEVWVAEVSGAIPPAQFFQARGTLSSLTWSPDGSRLAFVSNRGDHSFIGVYDTRSASLRYLAPSVDRDSEPVWSPDGAQIAFIRTNGGGGGGASFSSEGDRDVPWAIWVADLATGQGSEVWRAPAREGGTFSRQYGGALRAWAAGNRLVFTAELDGWNRLYSIPARGRGSAAAGGPGAAEAAVPTAQTAALPGQAAAPAAQAAAATETALSPANCEVEYLDFTPNKSAVFFASNCAGIDSRHLFRVSVSEGPAEQVTKGSGMENYPAVLADNMVAYVGSDAHRPLSVWFLAQVSAGGSSRLWRPQAIGAETIPADFPAAQLVEPKVVTFKAADGLEIHGQLFEPKGSGKHPAVIFVHGGPVRQMLPTWHYSYYYHNAYGLNQYLASRGYVVLSVNFRSGIGYGREFRNAPKRGRSGASEYQDVVAGAQYLRARSDVDPARIGIWGGSYGGYLTALALARNSDLFAAGVDFHGVHDWSTFQQGGAAPPAARAAARGGPGGAAAAAGAVAGQGGERSNVAFESSPMSAVKTWRSPVLLIHGDDDRNVSFGQTVELVARLREQKVTFEQLIFPDEVHDFLRHGHWLEAYHAAERFFDKYLNAK